MTTCYVCKKDEDCRPYGKNAQFICFNCMISDDKRQREAEQANQGRKGQGQQQLVQGIAQVARRVVDQRDQQPCVHQKPDARLSDGADQLGGRQPGQVAGCDQARPG